MIGASGDCVCSLESVCVLLRWISSPSSTMPVDSCQGRSQQLHESHQQAIQAHIYVPKSTQWCCCIVFNCILVFGGVANTCQKIKKNQRNESFDIGESAPIRTLGLAL
jgi:hypothetical protein